MTLHLLFFSFWRARPPKLPNGEGCTKKALVLSCESVETDSTINQIFEIQRMNPSKAGGLVRFDFGGGGSEKLLFENNIYISENTMSRTCEKRRNYESSLQNWLEANLLKNWMHN
jgi:hypothetical protein